MYPEYDPNEPTLGQSFADMLRGLRNPQNLKQVGQGLVNTAKLVPNVAESLVRGGVAQAVGTMGDLRDLRNTVQSYLPQGVQNFSNAAEFMTNPYAKALTQTAPTTEQTLDFVPRATAPYEGYKQHETLGEYIAPSLGYFGAKAVKATKDLPIGMTIQDVTPPIEPTKVAEALRLPEKNALGFYSPLEEAVSNLQNAKGTGQQYLAQLLKTQGVKQEEVATRGLDTFLESNPKVTRDQMAQYLRENPVNLQETVLGANSQRNLDTMNYNDYYLDEGRVLDDPDYVRSRADDIAYEYDANNPDIVQMMRENTMKELGFTADDLKNPYNEAKFQQKVNDSIYEDSLKQAEEEYRDNPFMEHTDELGYRVTGNDDLGYSVIDPNGNSLRYNNNGSLSIGQAEDAIREDALDRGFLHYPDDEFGTKYHDYTLPNGENYREVLIQYPNQRPAFAEKDIGRLNDLSNKTRTPAEDAEYKQLATRYDESLRGERTPEYISGHFDEPNILAHFRTTDRTIDGKKTLFVEEIQSDWHQAGRKKGYQGQKSEYEQFKNELVKKYNVEDLLDLQKVATPEENAKFNTLLQEQAKQTNQVPDAPFKKNWQELAMKRAMQMAAEGGYDRVAFTTGKQQANRYSLSKQIDSIDLIPAKDGDKQYVMQAWKDGNNVIRKAVNEDELPDLIGKEAAKKLLEQDPTSLHRPEGIAHGNPNVFQGRNLSGLDLDVGGEGMKGFYDKILPDFINKYGKKNGLKVGKTKVKLSTAKQDVEDAQLLNDLGVSDDAPNSMQQDVHYFDLTPEAKESFLKKGQPMFAAAPAVALTDEDTRRETLEKLFNSKK